MDELDKKFDAFSRSLDELTDKTEKKIKLLDLGHKDNVKTINLAKAENNLEKILQDTCQDFDDLKSSITTKKTRP